MNFEVGQGVQYKAFSVGNYSGNRYGLIVDVNDDNVSIIPVNIVAFSTGQGCYKIVSCFDENGAIYSRDKDNVRLKDCPPPFLNLTQMKSNVYAYANMSRVISFDEVKCRAYNV